MKRAWTGVFAAAVMVSLAACGGEPATIVNENAELEVLTVRMHDLQGKVASEGKMTPQLKGELATLVSDVQAWQKRTSRTDLTVTTSSPVYEAPTGTNALIKNPGGPSSCTPCPFTKVYDDAVCFLIDEGPCPDGKNGKVCVYTCIKRTRTAAIPAKPDTYA